MAEEPYRAKKAKDLILQTFSNKGEYIMALSQQKMVLQHLQEHGNITIYEAIQLYGATRLSAIIFNLRNNEGLDIVTDFETVRTRFGAKTKVARYKLRGQ